MRRYLHIMKKLVAAIFAVLLLSGCAESTTVTQQATEPTPAPVEVAQEKPKTAADIFADAQAELDGGYPQLAKKKLDALIVDFPDSAEVAEAKKIIASIDKEAAKDYVDQEKQARDLEKAIRANYGTETDINAGKMTAAIFADLTEGMTINEVTKLVGGSGELMSEGYGTAIYSYEGVGSIGANALITYQDGKLVSKAQAGLQ
ncbi:hypothetical protein [Paenibacillus tundrae]|uniref:PBP1b-binding outer membrane lipoprotein LpoB n=1 Tax=Paenibacillus tundrae TaxID=528187 RepID=A0ABT9W6C3_9BACL|nr:hypothetical protein [Paenibacillus tundrae]MDQ0168792.1 PBP1b-binding outer membrane lipoprotein LpoB [Paenibacillus tundrae]